MNGFLVDTNIPSELTRERPDPRVASFLQQAGKHSLYLSVMTIGEISKGSAALPESRKRTSLQEWFDLDVRLWFERRVLPISEEIAGLLGNWLHRPSSVVFPLR